QVPRVPAGVVQLGVAAPAPLGAAGADDPGPGGCLTRRDQVERVIGGRHEPAGGDEVGIHPGHHDDGELAAGLGGEAFDVAGGDPADLIVDQGGDVTGPFP